MDKKKLITKFVGIITKINYIYLHIKLSLKFLEKFFYIAYFTDQLKQATNR